MAFYAVKQGKKPGLYNNWDDCSEQVTGVSGSQFKKFKTMEEALTYLGTGPKSKTSNISKVDKPIRDLEWNSSKECQGNEPITESNLGGKYLEVFHCGRLIHKGVFNSNISEKQGRMNAFVDGSYRDSDKSYSSGVFILNHEGKYETLYSRGFDPETAKVRNVAGELIGAIQAIRHAIKYKSEEVIIHHDYIGIQKWADGEWKCKSNIAKQYKKLIDELRKEINIQFEKVVAHSSDFGNEVADKLASNC